MEATTFALLERVHGHLALLGLVVLLHPVLSLGRGTGLRRGTWISAVAAVALISPAFLLGLRLYPTWREQVKPGLAAAAPDVAAAFETKEHLAWFTLVLALSGVGVLAAAGRLPAGRRLARWLLGAAVVCGAVTAGLGLAVGGAAFPAW